MASFLPDPFDRTEVLWGLLAFGASAVVLLNRTRSSSGSGVQELRQPPGGHWLWGHEGDAFQESDSQWWLNNTTPLGLAYAMRGAFFHPDLAVIADPTAIHYMFSKNPSKFVKAAIARPLFERVAGRGLVWAVGETHRRQRQIVAPFFNHAVLRGVEDDVIPLILKGCDHLQRSLTESDPVGDRVDLIQWSKRVSIDVLGKVAFGSDFDFGEAEEAKVVLDNVDRRARLGLTTAGFAAPLALRSFPWLSGKVFSYTSAQTASKMVVKERAARQLLQRRKKVLSDEERSHTDLLDVLMSAMDPEDPEQADEMLDQVNTMLVAGFDTVAKQVSIALLELARHPELQAKLRSEVKSFIGSRSDGTATYDEYMGTKLPLLDAVVKEVARVHPIVPLVERVADVDDVIPLRFPIANKHGKVIDSISVKKGQVFWLPVRVINMNPLVWGPDGAKFDPYRWLEPGRIPAPAESVSGIYGTFTFVEGPRLCVGWRMAIYETKLMLAELLKRFEFKPTSEELYFGWSISVQPTVKGDVDGGVQLPLFVSSVKGDA